MADFSITSWGQSDRSYSSKYLIRFWRSFVKALPVRNQEANNAYIVSLDNDEQLRCLILSDNGVVSWRHEWPSNYLVNSHKVIKGCALQGQVSNILSSFQWKISIYLPWQGEAVWKQCTPSVTTVVLCKITLTISIGCSGRKLSVWWMELEASNWYVQTSCRY